MTRRLLASLLTLVLVPPASAAPTEGDPVLADEAVLKSVGLPADGMGLVEFFRLRAGADVAPERIAALVQQLDAAGAADREKACGELIAIGPPALPHLRRAA